MLRRPAACSSSKQRTSGLHLCARPPPLITAVPRPAALAAFSSSRPGMAGARHAMHQWQLPDAAAEPWPLPAGSKPDLRERVVISVRASASAAAGGPAGTSEAYPLTEVLLAVATVCAGAFGGCACPSTLHRPGLCKCPLLPCGCSIWVPPGGGEWALGGDCHWWGTGF